MVMLASLCVGGFLDYSLLFVLCDELVSYLTQRDGVMIGSP